MEVVDTIAVLRQRLDARRAAAGVAGAEVSPDSAVGSASAVGFVPTMGYLHEGHVSLVERSVSECDTTVASIFVNPLQFAANEDLAAYPRDLDRDVAMLEAAGCDLVLAPDVTEMYPRPMRTTVSVPSLSGHLEGAARPTHFDGVATVVAKLFAIVGPCRAYFGEKDFQQLAVVRAMAADLSLPVEVVGCPTVRAADGLALSSRNTYLSDDERQAATVLYRALQAGETAVADGATDAAAVRDVMAAVLAGEPLATPDYVEVVDPLTLEPLGALEPGAAVRLLVAARVGAPRLLDNLGVSVPPRHC